MISGSGQGKAGGDARPLQPQDLLVDTGPARQILSLWKSTVRTGSGDGRSRATAARIAQSPAYHTLRVFLRDQFACLTKDDEVARAIELPDSGVCGFGLDPAYRERDSLSAVLDEVESRGDRLRTRLVSRAARYLPEGGPWRKTTVWFVISSQTTFDAVTLVPGSAVAGGGPVVLVNLTDVLAYGETTRERVDGLEHVLAHELFHAGIRVIESGLPGWEPYRRTTNEVAFVGKAMLEEGVGHYVDFRDRPGSDSLFTWKPSSREVDAFDRLGKAIRNVRRFDSGRVRRSEIADMAVTGPTWGKYGAISGMFAAHRIEAARGPEALRDAIAGGPGVFLRTYRDVAATNPRLGRVPEELLLLQ
ncbi:MAG TPA: DUF5700 domain-containing putative Zn-dependent protease [Candidatus Eisenbacteria bacterium]|nr:DUF5700 domain-containing putative Zn-dependent protease [Candidatus Eisenbacteria bacterium]